MREEISLLSGGRRQQEADDGHGAVVGVDSNKKERDFDEFSKSAPSSTPLVEEPPPQPSRNHGHRGRE